MTDELKTAMGLCEGRKRGNGTKYILFAVQEKKSYPACPGLSAYLRIHMAIGHQSRRTIAILMKYFLFDMYNDILSAAR